MIRKNNIFGGSVTLNKLVANKKLDIRFSEVDSMNVVWHGNYMLYLEDAREAFGQVFGLDYLTIFNNGYYAPLVDVRLQYKHPVLYGMHPEIEILYQPTEAAKILFEYRITDGDTLIATASTVQVFMDKEYKLVLVNPPFYEEWKKRVVIG